MTHDEFIKEYDGKYVNFDENFGPQCVDLYRQYVQDVLGFPQSPPVEGARNIWTSYLQDKYERIQNTPKAVPKKGDIIIWGEMPGNPYGHVGIFMSGDVNMFYSFDQNWPVGSLATKSSTTTTM